MHAPNMHGRPPQVTVNGEWVSCRHYKEKNQARPSFFFFFAALLLRRCSALALTSLPRGQWFDATVRSDCLLTLSGDAAEAPTATIGVANWSRVYSLPLRICTAPEPTTGPRRRVMHVYEKHGNAATPVDLRNLSSQDVGMMDSVATHSRHALCSLNVTRYELSIHEKFLPIVMLSNFVAGAIRDGYIVPLLKPSFPNEVVITSHALNFNRVPLKDVEMDYSACTDGRRVPAALV